MGIVAQTVDVVVGVDTHTASHTLVAVAAGTGQVLGQRQVPTSKAGLGRARGWISGLGEPERVLVVIEGVGSYGAGLAREAIKAGLMVVEAPSGYAKPDRRGKGKTDTLDATRIARAVLGVDTSELRNPRADGLRQALRVLRNARRQMTDDTTRDINTLNALVRTIDLGWDSPGKLSISQINTIAAWRARPSDDPATAVARTEAVRLATAIGTLRAALRANAAKLQEVLAQIAPGLTEAHGVGPVTAATVVIAYSHPGRVRSEAAFACLSGTCPIPASSGNTQRHRLNRGGDRDLNAAIHTIALVRLRDDPNTKAYAARRKAEGKTHHETMRCLKRYIARQLYRQLTPTP